MTLDLEAPLATRFWTAVKIRTRKEMRGNWCIGYSSKYNMGVGVGNLPARRMWNLSGMSGATPVWLEVMHWLHGNDSSAPGSVRAGVVEQPVEDPLLHTRRSQWWNLMPLLIFKRAFHTLVLEVCLTVRVTANPR